MSKAIKFPSLFLGDEKTVTINCYDKNKNPLDLTNRTVYITIKRNLDEADGDAMYQQITNITETTVGSMQIQFTSEETLLWEVGTFPMDIRFSIQGFPQQINYTIFGFIEIMKPVTLDALGNGQ